MQRNGTRRLYCVPGLCSRTVISLLSSLAENTAVGIRHADHVAITIRNKVGTNFADKRRSLGRIIR
jgi:hypothetical protein